MCHFKKSFVGLYDHLRHYSNLFTESKFSKTIYHSNGLYVLEITYAALGYLILINFGTMSDTAIKTIVYHTHGFHGITLPVSEDDIEGTLIRSNPIQKGTGGTVKPVLLSIVNLPVPRLY